jgi:hypothetical protein
MSKKKNTLNDLEEFLKLQASSLVTPSSLTEKIKETPATPEPKKSVPVVANVQEEDLVKKVQRLAMDKKEFYDFIIQVTEGLPNKTKEDTLLINTALYLKGGSNWKAVVADYWKK